MQAAVTIRRFLPGVDIFRQVDWRRVSSHSKLRSHCLPRSQASFDVININSCRCSSPHCVEIRRNNSLACIQFPPSLNESQTAFPKRNIYSIRHQGSKASLIQATFLASLMQAAVTIRRFLPGVNIFQQVFRNFWYPGSSASLITAVGRNFVKVGFQCVGLRGKMKLSLLVC